MVKRRRNEHYSTVVSKKNTDYCEICDSYSHDTKSCIFNDESEFITAIATKQDEPTADELAEADAFLENEVLDSQKLQYQDGLRTVTGVMRIMEENGQGENADVIEEMGNIVRQTRRLHKVIKKSQEKRTGSFKTPEDGLGSE